MIDILLVNYNTINLVHRFLDVLHEDYEPGVWRLFIQDNGSTDGSAQFLSEVELSGQYKIDTLFLYENVGYAEAINAMARFPEMKSEFLVAVNADTWFSTAHVKAVEESFKEKPNAAVIGVKQMDEEARIRHGGIFWDGVGNPRHRGWMEKDPYDAKYKDCVPCWTVSGSIYYMRRSVWDELTQCPQYQKAVPGAIGAFLPTPMYFEETFFSVHAQHHGYEVWYDGTIPTAGHTWNASTGSEHTSKSRDLFSTSRELYIAACDLHGIHHECKVGV